MLAIHHRRRGCGLCCLHFHGFHTEMWCRLCQNHWHSYKAEGLSPGEYETLVNVALARSVLKAIGEGEIPAAPLLDEFDLAETFAVRAQPPEE
jgi:hypothetical protein